MGEHCLIRYNAGGQWGLGHHFRCQLLAESLQSIGIGTTFAVNHHPFLQDYLANGSCETEWVEEQEILPEGITSAFDAVLIDLPFAVPALSISTAAVKTIVLDQHGPAAAAASLTVNAIAHPEGQESRFSHVYTGPDYMILDPEILLPPHTPESPVERILISAGGSDPHGITGFLLQALDGSFPDISFLVLAGPAFGNQEEIRAFCRHREAFTYMEGGSSRDVARGLSSCDLALLSFGLTVYAAAHAAIPTVIIAHDQHGGQAAQSFTETTRTGHYLGVHGDVGEATLINELSNLISEPQLRRQISENGPDAVDGHGQERVAGLIAALIR